MAQPNWTQPSDVFAEQIILAEVLEKPERIDLVSGILTPEDMFDENHRWVLTAMLEVSGNGQAPDIVGVHGWLQSHGRAQQVTATALGELVNTMPASDIEKHIARVKELALLRRFISTARRIVVTAETWSGDVRSFLLEAERAVHDIAAESAADDTLCTLRDAMTRKLQLWVEQHNGNDEPGVSTGLPDLDSMVSCLRPGTLTYVAGRPGTGKSSLAMNQIAIHCASKGFGSVVFFSLEMAERELTDRLIASQARIPTTLVHDWRRMRDEYQRAVQAAKDVVDGAPLYIDDKGGVSIAEVRMKCKRADRESRRKHGVGLALVVIDYMQLLAEPAGSRSREQAVGANSRELKRLAKDLKVPVVALAQLNRESEKANARPKLSNLRESGSLEGDADMVWLLYHPDEERDSVVELIVAKNRFGPTGVVKLHWEPRFTRFDSHTEES